MICRGGNRVGPKPGFWRRNATASMFLQCPFPLACTGGLGEDGHNELSSTGHCSEGHHGNLCA